MKSTFLALALAGAGAFSAPAPTAVPDFELFLRLTQGGHSIEVPVTGLGYFNLEQKGATATLTFTATGGVGDWLRLAGEAQGNHLQEDFVLRFGATTGAGRWLGDHRTGACPSSDATEVVVSLTGGTLGQPGSGDDDESGCGRDRHGWVRDGLGSGVGTFTVTGGTIQFTSPDDLQ
jgi:hypothetical protein